MTIRTEPWSQGSPSWVDLMTSDQASASDFYGTLFGWTIEDSGPDMGHYAICQMGGQPVAGLGQLPAGQNIPPAWTVYLAVDDVDKTCDSITANDGTIAMPPMDVADQGRMAVAVDPNGAFFGLWQAGAHMGTTVTGEPGTMCWHENMSRNPASARAFYEAVFGYAYEPMPGADDYSVIAAAPGEQEGGRGGIGQLHPSLPAEIPAHWMTYFAVVDVDSAVTQASASGGEVRMGAFDTPYGRMAVISDPQGAVFTIIAPTKD